MVDDAFANHIVDMTRVFVAALSYFSIVFAFGFVLGVVRTMVLAPATDPLVAVIVEMPFILIAAWFACRFIVGRFHVRAVLDERLTMGILAFFCLLAGEMLLSIFLLGGSAIEFLQMFELPENRIGLGGQIAFALFPVIQLYESAQSEP